MVTSFPSKTYGMSRGNWGFLKTFRAMSRYRTSSMWNACNKRCAECEGKTYQKYQVEEPMRAGFRHFRATLEVFRQVTHYSRMRSGRPLAGVETADSC